MHDLEIIQQGDVASLPLQVERDRIGNLDDGVHVAEIYRLAISKRDRFIWIIARIAPAPECRN